MLSCRQLFRTATFKNSAALQQEIYSIFLEEADPSFIAPDVVAYINFQPISKSFIANSKKNGGNALGLTVDDGPLMCMSSGSPEAEVFRD